jgi:hypothetical protein
MTLSRPDSEFVEAYNELTAVNKHLGGIRAVERFLPEDTMSVLDVASGGCDVGEALASRRKVQGGVAGHESAWTEDGQADLSCSG